MLFDLWGLDIVVLTRAADKCVTLRDLEAQYTTACGSEPCLKIHLGVDPARIRYIGSCRTLTNKIAASNAALMSALGSRWVRVGRGRGSVDGI